MHDPVKRRVRHVPASGAGAREPPPDPGGGVGLFRGKGYAAPRCPRSRRRRVSQCQTVYKAFANKATLLKAVFDVTVAGDDEDVPIAGRDFIAAIQAEPDAAGRSRCTSSTWLPRWPRRCPGAAAGPRRGRRRPRGRRGVGADAPRDAARR